MNPTLFKRMVTAGSLVAALLLCCVAVLAVRLSGRSAPPPLRPLPSLVRVGPIPDPPFRPGPPLPDRRGPFVTTQKPVAAPGHWPQWRGPNRDNISTETGLLKEWPSGGPPLLWTASGLGEGKGGISVAGGLIYLLGYRDGLEFLTALDGDGRVAWSTPIGAAVNETFHMRWLSQRTPTVDDDQVYALTARGILLCLNSSNGGLLWQRDYSLDFGGRPGIWGGYCDFPLADGPRVICTPAGPRSTVVALDRRTGSTVWSCDVTSTEKGSQSALQACRLAGIRQYVTQLDSRIVGISAQDGRLLWSHPLASAGGGVQVAIPWTDTIVFSVDGWARTLEELEVTAKDGRLAAVSRYQEHLDMEGWFANEIRFGDRLYTFLNTTTSVRCVDLRTGQTRYRQKTGGTYATSTGNDGHFYLRGGRGEMTLADAGEDSVKILSTFKLPQGREETFTFPVIAGGRLYLREQDQLLCFDVRSPDYRASAPLWNIASRVGPAAAGGRRPDLAPPKGEPDAIFVPTPMDVVEKMLELAGVTKNDRVADLGSGDGRILIAASGRTGCKSTGYEIDPALVRDSRTRIKDRGLSHLALVEDSDLFRADLSKFSVVTLYLGEANNARLLPQLRQLKAGARIVSHAHGLGAPGIAPDRTEEVQSQEDGATHSIYLWIAPLKEK